MNAAMRILGTLLGAVATVALLAGPARADAAMAGTDVTVAQSLGERDLTVVLRRVTSTPGPLQVDIITHAGSPAGTLQLRATPDVGGTASTARVTLPQEPGPVSATLTVAGPGPWELAIDDGQRVARIPFVVHAQAMSPAERTAYAGFVTAGLMLALTLVVAHVARHPGPALVPGAGFVAAVAVAVVAALLSASQPDPPVAGEHLDPTVANATDPYRNVPRVTSYSRPPLTLTVRQRQVAVGVPQELELDLTDAATGLPADDLVVHDGALMHLMVVSPSGRLWHRHPVRTAPGRYLVTMTPDAAGKYRVAAEATRRGGGVQMLRAHDGFTATGAGATAVEPLGLRGSATVDGVDVHVAMADPVAGTPVTLRARIGDESDLQPWLGMLGHLIVTGPGDDPAVWMHAHAMDDGTAMPEGHDMAGMAMVPMPGPLGLTLPDETVAAYGPVIGFTTAFPEPGRYRMWLQAEKDYRIVTVPLAVDVGPAPDVPPGPDITARTELERTRVGTQDVTVALTGDVPTIQVQALLPTMGYASPVLTGVPQGDGRFLVRGVPLMAAGGWQLRLTPPAGEPLTIPLIVTD